MSTVPTKPGSDSDADRPGVSTSMKKKSQGEGFGEVEVGKGRSGMAEAAGTTKKAGADSAAKKRESQTAHDDEEGEDDDDENEDEDEEDDEDDSDDSDSDDEPRLKYARLTQHLGSVYRNGDATSAFLVAGDKMIVGTHNGNIHVFQIPTFHPLRIYHAHSASVTSISISPNPPPLSRADVSPGSSWTAPSSSSIRRSEASSALSPSASPQRARHDRREPAPVPNTPSNNIYIATSSTDGHVCVQSLIDLKDVQLRNFGRPVQAVALSPDYRADRTYLSGGLAGNLVLTVGGGPGRSTSTTAGTSAAAAAAAAASGWLGSMGLVGVGGGGGRDTVLHAGEGTVSTIRWSLSGRYIAWLNETGIKIMRSKTELESADAESAWKRIGHIDRPQSDEWDTMASVWRGRAEWTAGDSKGKDGVERLLVGWGGTIWIIHVHPGGVGVGKNVGERSVGRAEIVKILRMDCIISGISLFSDNLLLVLAYCLPDDGEDDNDKGNKTASKKPHSQRFNNLPPELRLIDLDSQTEVDKDVLSVGRFERLAAADYHLGVLPAQAVAAAAVSSRGAFEALAGIGSEMWNAAINPKMLFSSGASIRSHASNDGAGTGPASIRTKSIASMTSRGSMTSTGTVDTLRPAPPAAVHPLLAKDGMKIFIHSPYDCILSTERDLSDHLAWMLEHEDYEQAWHLVDEHPEAVGGGTAVAGGEATPTDSTLTATSTSTDTNCHPGAHFHDSSDLRDPGDPLDALARAANTPAEREKRRIGELWIKAVVQGGDWTRAGQIAGHVLRSADAWERWVWTFAGAGRFDDITDQLPTEALIPPLPRTVYEVLLGHYLQTDRRRFQALLDRWPTELFDVSIVVAALERRLGLRGGSSGSGDGDDGTEYDETVPVVDPGSDDWRIIMESLARLHEATGRFREALKCHIRLHDADAAFRLIGDYHLADAVTDDIPSFITLRVPAKYASHRPDAEQLSAAELEAATAEAICLLVDEAQHGLVHPETVVAQLQAQELHLYTYFYLRGLWTGAGLPEHQGDSRDRLLLESKAHVDPFADLAVHLFALFDQPLLMDFLKASTSYSFDKAVQECEQHNYLDELVYLYSKTGQMKRALYLLIDRLGDVARAIAFAKEQDDPDLWEDLLKYSLDKPRFIRGLLELAGTAIDPTTLVRRIPEGLEIPGLRAGLQHMMREHEIQYSISRGVARVLRSEVAAAQAMLRNGQRRGIRFDVVGDDGVESEKEGGGEKEKEKKQTGDHEVTKTNPPLPGQCARCRKSLSDDDDDDATPDTLVGFACGHVFHLTHLLGLEPAEADAIPGLRFSSLAGSNNVAGGLPFHAGRVSVGSKIMHARLLRDRVQGGCPVCRENAKEDV